MDLRMVRNYLRRLSTWIKEIQGEAVTDFERKELVTKEQVKAMLVIVVVEKACVDNHSVTIAV